MTRKTLALVFAVFLMFTAGPIAGQGRSPSDVEIRQAANAIEQANSYDEIVAATERYASVISSPRVVELVDGLLQNPSLNEAQRNVLLIERQLSLESRAFGAATAAKLLAIRAIAGTAMSADTSQQLAAALDKFSPLAGAMTPALVRQALDTPGNSWPKPLLPLMEQLARDWPKFGSLGAATRMAEAANNVATSDPTPVPSRAPSLIGHWRSTSISFGSPRDEHLVVREDGTAETWIVTASSRTPVTRGRWSVKGTTLSVDWEDGRQWGQPFTFHEGQLVFPNAPNRRQFWETIR